jgi:ferredoxin-NADP reductase
MYIAVGVAILWYRFIVPARQAWQQRMRVEAVIPEGPGVVSIVVSGKHIDALQAEAGHFFRWRFLTRDLWWASNPYSLSAAPKGDRLRITVKDLGEHSAMLAHLRPGTRVFAEGPYGAMTSAHRRRRKVLLVAGGIGITPLRALFEALPADPGEISLLYRASRPGDMVFRSELEHIARERGARLHLLTGTRAALGHDPLSQEALERNFPDLCEHDVYICGSDSMSHAVVKALRAARVPRRQLHHESFVF